MAKGDARFALRIVPFLAMMGFGSWGLSQFLKMPTQMKDARAKDRRANRQKFDLEKENERLQSEMQETLQNYENVRVPRDLPAGEGQLNALIEEVNSGLVGT